jgi:hypothetical protein
MRLPRPDYIGARNDSYPYPTLRFFAEFTLNEVNVLQNDKRGTDPSLHSG